MKALTLILLVPIIAFSQEETRKSAPAKQSTTDCPTWNKKGKSPRADYFQYLKSGGTRRNQPTTSASANIPKVKERKPKERSEPIFSSGTSVQSPNTEAPIAMKQEKKSFLRSKSVENKDKETVKEQKNKETAVPVQKKIEAPKEVADSDYGTTETNKSNDSKLEAKNKSSKNNGAFLRKAKHFFSRKGAKVSKKNDQKCPSF